MSPNNFLVRDLATKLLVGEVIDGLDQVQLVDVPPPGVQTPVWKAEDDDWLELPAGRTAQGSSRHLNDLPGRYLRTRRRPGWATGLSMLPPAAPITNFSRADGKVTRVWRGSSSFIRR
jgi:hypothetical protein